MKQYSLVREFGNCAAGITGTYESLPTKTKSASLMSLLPKQKANRGQRRKRVSSKLSKLK